MLKVDVLQVFINASATFGIGVIWINFNEKVFKTVRRLAAAPFYLPDPVQQKPAAAPLLDEESDSDEHVCEACWADHS